MKRTLRLAAGTLALALPLAAAAGCGAQKKKTVQEEMRSAMSNLRASKAASMTVHFTDAQGSFVKAMTKDGDVPPVLAAALVKGSITITSDPGGDATFGSLSKGRTGCGASTDLGKELDKSNSSFLVRDDKADLAELRVVSGALYAHVNLPEVSALATAAGAKDVDATLDETARSMGPQVVQALTDVRAGKWLKLPLTPYLDQLKDLAQSVQPSAAPSAACDYSGVVSRAMTAVKPYVKVTDANDDSDNRVLDVRVQVAQAVSALLASLKADSSLPFASALKGLDPAEVTKDIKPGTANGRIRLHDGHLKGFDVDLESIRQLSNDPGTDSFAGVRLGVDVNDSAGAVQAPTNVSSVDLQKLVQDLVGSIFGATGRAGAGFSG